MLKQRAKMNWLKEGDVCSRIFSRKYVLRGQLAGFIRFKTHKNILRGDTMQRSIHLVHFGPWARHKITPQEAGTLELPVTGDEIKEALFSIADDKAPGPNGFSTTFFKTSWSIIGKYVVKGIQEFFQSGSLLQQTNATILALIPKVQLPIIVADYRPIACCNVVYKVITKVLVNRMKGVLDLIVDPSQNAFVPRWKISDNLLLAQELLAGYNQNHLPPRCTLKVDLRKAYDSIEWNYLSTANSESLKVYKEILDDFAGLSGLQVNAHKSHIIVSRSASTNQQRLAGQLGFQVGSLPLKYLGVPLVSSRLTIQQCQPLIRKMEDRILAWGSQFMSFAARIQLIKDVLTALFLYWGQAFFLPLTVIERIERIFRHFLWRGSNSRGYAKVAWAQICLPKAQEGQGLQRI
ncbi:UNVERIFIED_CONTAM: hypothetical protein Sradi_0771800 [Sesamum radiatum]|uniref:Reverse transcriptase domain-containing protein n=1 Tax=Sesamum radiatum TaxID=300843 RepID=A0AAW2VQC0_SESRA